MRPVDIDGLGSFRKTGKGYRFTVASFLPRIFFTYGMHERPAV